MFGNDEDVLVLARWIFLQQVSTVKEPTAVHTYAVADTFASQPVSRARAYASHQNRWGLQDPATVETPRHRSAATS